MCLGQMVSKISEKSQVKNWENSTRRKIIRKFSKFNRYNGMLWVLNRRISFKLLMWKRIQIKVVWQPPCRKNLKKQMWVSSILMKLSKKLCKMKIPKRLLQWLFRKKARCRFRRKEMVVESHNLTKIQPLHENLGKALILIRLTQAFTSISW